jgi:hypothetical protein
MNDGIYWGIPKSAVTTTSSNNNPQLEVKFDVTAVANDQNGWDDISPAQERTIWISLTDKAWKYSKPKLDKLGFTGNFDAPAFNNTEGVELVCKNEEYNGRAKEKWDLNGFGGGTATKAASDVTRRLNALYKQAS